MTLAHNSIRISRQLVAQESCVFCAFNRSYGAVQKRFMARPAPSTRFRQRAEKQRVITPESEERKKMALDRKESAIERVAKLNTLTMDRKIALCYGNRELAMRLSDNMVWFLADFRESHQTDKDFKSYMMSVYSDPLRTTQR